MTEAPRGILDRSAKVCIVAIQYEEPEWQETKSCIEATGLPVFYIGRNPKGVGSLAEAINRGVFLTLHGDEHGFHSPIHYQYIWIVTNVTFSPRMAEDMAVILDTFPGIAAVHPCFKSDHEHMKKKEGELVTLAPFIEFTAAMVRTEVFKKFPLDDKMPYVGHDMAWGYDVRQAGYKIGVYHGEILGHTYIRHNKIRNKYTDMRKKLRRRAVQPTIDRLIDRYGKDYKEKIQYWSQL